MSLGALTGTRAVLTGTAALTGFSTSTGEVTSAVLTGTAALTGSSTSTEEATSAVLAGTAALTSSSTSTREVTSAVLTGTAALTGFATSTGELTSAVLTGTAALTDSSTCACGFGHLCLVLPVVRSCASSGVTPATGAGSVLTWGVSCVIDTKLELLPLSSCWTAVPS